MKTTRIFVLLIALVTFSFQSCSDSSPIENEVSTEKSIALRTVLNKLKIENTVGPNRNPNMGNPPAMLCFEFVFPMTFSFNNGTVVVAANLDGLLNILNNETPNLYLEGVVFPFQVQVAGAVQTITSEEDLVDLILQCGLPTFDDDLQYSYCFDIEFPINITSAGQLITINSQEELNAYLANPSSGNEAQIVYPITVINQNEIIVVNNIFEFYQLVNSCNDNQCICTLEYAPVCVQTVNGIVEYSNACFAQCAGFTQNDFITCNPTTDCSITGLTTTVGACNPDGSYALTIDFDYQNTSATTFQVWNSNSQLVGTYQLSALPVTIPSYVSSDATIPSDYLDVRISQTCMASQQWTKPVCNNCICTTEVNPVCVMVNGQIVTYGNPCLAQCDGYSPSQFVNCNPNTTFNFMELLGTCFNITYPVTVQYQGAVTTVTSNSQLVQYYNPATQTMPTMTYPIAVTWGLQTATFIYNSQVAFENAIIANCN